MSIAALIVSVLALCASIAAITAGVRQARIDRESAYSTAVSQVKLDKTLLLMEQCRTQLIEGLQALFAAMDECRRTADEIREAFAAANGARLPQDSLLRIVGSVQELSRVVSRRSGILWRFPEVVGLVLRPFPVSGQMGDVVSDAQRGCRQAGIELGQALSEYVNSAEVGSGRLLHVASVAEQLGAYGEFLMSLQFSIEIYYQNAVLGGRAYEFHDGPFVQVVDGLWHTAADEWQPELDWEYHSPDDPSPEAGVLDEVIEDR